MQSPPSKGPVLPYDRWTKHKAENGLEYLAHPETGEVKWLWSRHRDPKTGKDYLVNTITSFRQWVNPSNEHLCPVRLDISSGNDNSDNKQSPSASKVASTDSQQNRPGRSSAANAAAAAAANRRNQAQQFVEIPAPKSLGLGPDEALMEMRSSGRRYIFNKRSKKSRWLPADHPASKFVSSEPGKQTKAATNPTNVGSNSYPMSRAKAPSMPTPPPRLASEESLAQTKSTATEPTVGINTHGNREEGSAEATIREKIKILGDMVEAVDAMTSSGKYSIRSLREMVERVENSDGGNRATSEDSVVANQRLLELNEYLMQQTLKVDGVESQGDGRVRKRRKETVDRILHLMKQTEELRKRLRDA